MKKRTYQSKKINQIDWEKVKMSINGEPIVFAIDVAKTEQFALLSYHNNQSSQHIRWQHPQETRLMLSQLENMDCPVVVVMESTSTYGDALRYQCQQKGFEIHQANAKRVHDAKEVYDGVPSLHDAKSASIIGRFYWDGLTVPWQELSEKQRHMRALCREYEIHQSQYLRNLNRLEAYLSRHWPEVMNIIETGSVSLEQLLISYGTPQQVAANASEARAILKKACRNMLSQEKIGKIIESAINTLGVPCIEAEKQFLQALAQEMMHSRLAQRQAQKALEAEVDREKTLTCMAKLIGRLTTAVLLSLHLDPRNYHCARSFLKAAGLNLKEKSSGRYVGQLKLTKRGSAKARQYLYFAALRLIQSCPLAKQWYEKKMTPKAKNKAVIAVMRKLTSALWYVSRGEEYDPRKLFNVSTKPA